MKGKKLIWVALPVSVMMILAACGGDKTDPSSTSASSSDVTSSVTPTPSSTPTTESSSSVQDPVTHRAGLNKTLAEGAVTRAYDERFDKEVEDFSGASLLGTTTGTQHNGYLRVIADSNLDSFPQTPGSAIFKCATATFGGDKTLMGQGSVHFKMRVTEGKLDLKNLIFGVRCSDDSDAHTYEINMASALNSDGETNPALTSEFQDINISLGDTIDDANTVFPETTLKVLQEAVGFHLYCKADAELSAVVEIAEVSFVKGEATTVIDDFARNQISGNKNVYWGPTDCVDAVLIRKGINLAKDKSYTTPVLTEAQRGLTHLVLSAQGDLSGAKVAVTYDDASATVKELPFASLKAKGTNAVANAVDGVYSDLAIDLSTFNGPTDANVKTIAITNTGDKVLEISNVFMTSFEEPQLDKRYPLINTETAVTFDNFNRTYNVGNFPSGAAGYDASAQEEQNISAGINGITSWSMADKISMKDGTLNLPATGEGYAEVSVDSSHIMEGAQYLVFSIKGEEGADLSLFRFAMGGKTIYFNAAHAMEGVKTYGDDTYPSPYTTESGFTWYIVDLDYEGVVAKNSIKIYYTGAKAIQIDSVFFAESFMAYDQDVTEVENPQAQDLSGYKYVGGKKASWKSDYFTFTVSGDGTATFASLRFAYNGAERWIDKNNPKGPVDVFDSNGILVNATDKIPEEETQYYVDLSAYPTSGDGYVHFHAGDASCSGSMTVTSYGFAKNGYITTANVEKTVELDPNTDSGYMYVSGWTATNEAKAMFIHLTGDNTNDLSLFRVEQQRDGAKVGEFWANAKPLLKNVDGTAFDITTKIDSEGVDVVLDLEAAGMTVEVGDTIHFHMNAIAAGTITFNAALAASDYMPTNLIISNYDQTFPTVTPTTPEE